MNVVVASSGLEFDVSLKYSPGNVRGVPNTISAAEQPKSSFKVLLRARSVRGKFSTQLETSDPVLREAFSER